MKALKFLDRLRARGSRFEMEAFPSELGIKPYQSADTGVRSLLSTETDFTFTVRYTGDAPTTNTKN